MSATPVIAVFDIGKTNKKLLLFDEQYQMVYESSERLDEIQDEDGDPCEDVHLLTRWMKTKFSELQTNPGFEIRALNFSGYGASFVYLDAQGDVAAPLYNYLKPYPEALAQQFYQQNGKLHKLCVETASPPLKSLNSGMQLFRIKCENPALFKRIKYALHLPQYLSYVFSGVPLTEITSLGCHTHLWDFSKQDYHDWVKKEGLVEKFPPLSSASIVGQYQGIPVGPGYHDSSAALVPYLRNNPEPFLLLSTGTWSISMNPFNGTPLTLEDFAQDCLCYLTPEGQQVKSSRLFTGPLYDNIVHVLNTHYGISNNAINAIEYDPSQIPVPEIRTIEREGSIETLEEYTGLNYVEHFHLGMQQIIRLLKPKIERVLTPDVTKIFVDGGFSQNKVFMAMLAREFSTYHVSAASLPQASALGAAMLTGIFKTP